MAGSELNCGRARRDETIVLDKSLAAGSTGGTTCSWRLVFKPLPRGRGMSVWRFRASCFFFGEASLSMWVGGGSAANACSAARFDGVHRSRPVSTASVTSGCGSSEAEAEGIPTHPADHDETDAYSIYTKVVGIPTCSSIVLPSTVSGICKPRLS